MEEVFFALHFFALHFRVTMFGETELLCPCWNGTPMRDSSSDLPLCLFPLLTTTASFACWLSWQAGVCPRNGFFFVTMASVIALMSIVLHAMWLLRDKPLIGMIHELICHAPESHR